ncbi:MAG: serine hydroxymethyltransferase [Bacilli bacterium]|jgi:glycine hydroxymethyltransferase|nr:serine hydroxymethyltransferase [Bacilli bacterium]
MLDKEVSKYFALEEERQNKGIELICSENYPSVSVREAAASIFTAKYAEGYPGHRYYGGCENVDAVENIAIDRCCRLFKVKHANVQPHSGSQANFAAYHAIINPGDTVLSLILNDGGHLTHGSPVSFSAEMYKFVHYPLGEDGHLDYKKIQECLGEYNPNLFLAGYSAYPYEIDFKKMRELIDQHNSHSGVHCYFMVDMAHIAGIIAAGLTQNPCDYADIVTSTTHKTLRGPRGGIILCNDDELFKKVNKAVFPYTQGGPLEHIIAAKAVCFNEDLHPDFKKYMQGVLNNTKACDEELKALGCVCSGSENHLLLLNVLESFSITGKEAQARLERIGVTANKNMLHGDSLKPGETSGLRVGFAAATSRGCDKKQAKEIADLIYKVLSCKDESYLSFHEEVQRITSSWKDVMKLEYPLAE